MGDESKRVMLNGADFMERMPAAAFICRAEGDLELLFANQSLVHLFECESLEEFLEQVGHSFYGMVSGSQARGIRKEISLQVQEKNLNSGRLFYHIMTKKGNIYLAEEHWALVQDPVEGPLFYSFLISREYESSGADYDEVTGLYGKTRFQTYVTEWNQELSGKTTEKYVVGYLNLVNFKLLNVNKGIDEGDACLRAIADCLGSTFEDAFLARLSDDHFVIFDTYENLEERMAASKTYFHEKYGDRFGVIGKWGYYPFVPNENFDAQKAISYAKIACDYIKYDASIYIIEYSEEIEQKQNKAEYLVRSFEKALEEGWIKVYFQPVIRAITGQLCGMESLVRWIDPTYGYIVPGEFISILEESRQIHLLDSYMVEQVCKIMRERLNQKLPIVPVSVNFSRLDFVMCDMLKVVETAIEKYDIPRDYLHVEITESMIASDEALMRGVINGFRSAGYEIWMDDFGSGYSSLTLLKDYQFDMLKLDMNFLSNFTDKSRDIMRSAVIMAKDLGIKTLAEGVETQEHLDYLKAIGCEQIQGYYYGKPEPIEDLFAHLREKDISIELRRWRHFYEMASFSVKATDMPLEVIEDDGETFRTLFMNEPYKEQIGVQNYGLAEIDRRIYHTASPLLEQYRNFADQMKLSGKPETFYYTKGDTYLCLRGQVVAQKDGRSIIKASIYNVTTDQNTNRAEMIDSKLRALNLLFKVILFADLKTQTLTPLLGTSATMRTREMDQGNLMENNMVFAENNIFPTERSRYRAFMDFTTAGERIKNSMFGYVTNLFQIKQPDGSYRTAEISLMAIPGTDGQEFLYCVKPYYIQRKPVEEDTDDVQLGKLSSEGLRGGENLFKLLWNNILWNSTVKFFWKDRSRRYLGASQAFMDFFGLNSLNELVGKTDEEMHWHINDDPYREQEMAILQRGIRISDTPGQCIAKGVLHNTIINKMAIYQDGLIVGLMGYILDADKSLVAANENFMKIKRDPITNLLDAHSFADAMIDYALRYHEQQSNYAVIVIRNARASRILETYGEDTMNESLREIGKGITEVMGARSVIMRAKESIFGVLMHVEDEQELQEKAEQIQKRLSGINSVKGNSVTMRIRISYKVRTWEGVTDENIYESALREVLGD